MARAVDDPDLSENILTAGTQVAIALVQSGNRKLRQLTSGEKCAPALEVFLRMRYSLNQTISARSGFLTQPRLAGSRR
jgi:hypothetical protein